MEKKVIKGFFKDCDITGLDLICVLGNNLSESQKKEVICNHLQNEGYDDMAYTPEDFKEIAESIVYGAHFKTSGRVYFFSEVAMYE